MPEGLIIAIIGASSSLLAAPLVIFTKYLINKVQKRKYSKIQYVLERLRCMYRIFYDMVHETPANRVALLRLTNGGGIPRVGATLRSSVVHEAEDGSIRALGNRWQSQPVSPNHLEILRDMFNNESTEVSIDDIEEDTALYNLYRADNIQKTLIYLMKIGKEELLYLVINFQDMADLESIDKDYIRSKVVKLKSLILDTDII